jgi:hypothetical protein
METSLAGVQGQSVKSATTQSAVTQEEAEHEPDSEPTHSTDESFSPPGEEVKTYDAEAQHEADDEAQVRTLNYKS